MNSRLNEQLVLRNGLDLVELPRFEEKLRRREGRLEERLFDREELRLCAGRSESLAAFFAAKEACAKALGCGLWGEEGLGFHDLRIRKDEKGAPRLELSDKALELAARHGRLLSTSLSLSHTARLAAAQVTLLFTCPE